ncbi:hypothetical protein CKM354_000103800 [Cercospora kikuchii]|uniref:Uncharacterized protein n=1 Tax=Cercospora kikuchii TaxID=84275 RepID=A0A9P3CC16_9PEZI|nr:uncharacterized protein CKM354_000103800 [Cercospora kikuchii]GIZ37595.1 hypothetical protein CKM354_000103800 [Cercospora kikuchii]
MAGSSFVHFLFENESQSPEAFFQLQFPEDGRWSGYLFEADDVAYRKAIQSYDLARRIVGPQESIAYGHTVSENTFFEGVEGRVEVYSREQKIARIEYFTSWTEDNQLKVTEKAEDWEIEASGGKRRGEMGYVRIGIKKKG